MPEAINPPENHEQHRVCVSSCDKKHGSTPQGHSCQKQRRNPDAEAHKASGCNCQSAGNEGEPPVKRTQPA